MCGTPHERWRAQAGVLCRSIQCAGRHAMLAASAKCSQCTRPLTVAQMASGVCGSRICREEAHRDLIAATAAREEALARRLQRRRGRSAAQRGLTPEVAATYHAALLPHNDDRPSRLPARRRALHEAHLRRCLAEARESLAAAPPAELPMPAAPSEPQKSAHEHAVAAVLLAGCAACRGRCCREAQDHAFITADRMMELLQRNPGVTDDAIVARYLSHAGEVTLTNGCVYQGQQGCTLDPELRADICHRFLCKGLTALQRAVREGEPIRAYLVHRRGEEFRGDRFIEIPVENPSAALSPSGADGPAGAGSESTGGASIAQAQTDYFP